MSMTIFTVGGAVRDELLGRPVQDRDFVVVGTSPETMLARGFKPVGKDFPVFLHPQTKEEYALARTERKTGRGYHGFAFHASPEVTLEEDLARRDLTINAMARDETGRLIDPYGGLEDLRRKVLRHVSPAFAEDPVRILRVARFSARLPDFTLAPETLALMRRMVEEGEVDHLVPERVWQELARGLMEPRPDRMIEVLRACGALARLLPEIDTLFGIPQPPNYHPEIDTGVHVLAALRMAAERALPLPTRFAVLLHDVGKGRTPPELWPHHYGHEARGAALIPSICARLRTPVECRELAVLTAREHGLIHRGPRLRPATRVRVLERCDALRRPERFLQLLDACACDALGRPGLHVDYAPVATLWRDTLEAARSVDAGAIARTCAERSQIPARLHEARVAAVKARERRKENGPVALSSPTAKDA